MRPKMNLFYKQEQENEIKFFSNNKLKFNLDHTS